MGQFTNQDKHACPRCQIGTMQPTTATYTAMYRGSLLSIPNIPAWTCDICQYTEYEDMAMGRLEALAGEYLFAPEAERQNAKLPTFDSDGDAEGKPSTRLKP